MPVLQHHVCQAGSVRTVELRLSRGVFGKGGSCCAQPAVYYCKARSGSLRGYVWWGHTLHPPPLVYCVGAVRRCDASLCVGSRLGPVGQPSPGDIDRSDRISCTSNATCAVCFSWLVPHVLCILAAMMCPPGVIACQTPHAPQH